MQTLASIGPHQNIHSRNLVEGSLEGDQNMHLLTKTLKDLQK